MKIDLSPDESGYLLGLMKEHLEYYRLLSGNGKCTATSRARLAMLEALEIKLKSPHHDHLARIAQGERLRSPP